MASSLRARGLTVLAMALMAGAVARADRLPGAMFDMASSSVCQKPSTP
jgi:hypothetical protein